MHPAACLIVTRVGTLSGCVSQVPDLTANGLAAEEPCPRACVLSDSVCLKSDFVLVCMCDLTMCKFYSSDFACGPPLLPDCVNTCATVSGLAVCGLTVCVCLWFVSVHVCGLAGYRNPSLGLI